MLSEASFVVNHWITILWIIVAGLYTTFAILVDIYHAKTAKTSIEY